MPYSKQGFVDFGEPLTAAQLIKMEEAIIANELKFVKDEDDNIILKGASLQQDNFEEYWSQTVVTIQSLIEAVFLADEQQNLIRNKPINCFKFYSYGSGKVFIVKKENVDGLIDITSEIDPTVLKEVDAVQGWNTVIFDTDITIADNEYIGIYDTNKIFGFARGIGAIPFYTWSASNKKWSFITSDSAVSFVIGYRTIEEVPVDIQLTGNTSTAANNKLQGKKFSLIGDSISTYTGYIPSGYLSFYPNGEVTSVDQTWWKILEKESGMSVLKNAAWSGSTCKGNSSSTTSAQAGCSTKRVNDLADGDITPDIVITFIGINDFSISNHNTPIGEWNSTKEIPADSTSITTFSEAYAIMVNKIMKTYPHARVFCCTLMQTGKISKDQDNTGIYPTKNASGVALEEYNKVIRDVANGLGADVIELTKCGINFYNFKDYTVVDTKYDDVNGGDNDDPQDYLHPNIAGHKLVAQKMLAEILAKY